MRLPRFHLLSAALAVVIGLPAAAEGQAFCALRDPVQTIYELYPTATGYRSIVATVDESARTEIARRLGVLLHHAELGRHTLYVPVKGNTPIGLVQVRSERTQWGLAEVAWALDFDLRVVDFRIQRSRSASREALESDAFRSSLRGKTAAELSILLAPGGAALRSTGPRLTGADDALAVAIVTSGLKTIAASETVWGEDIRRFRAASRGVR